MVISLHLATICGPYSQCTLFVTYVIRRKWVIHANCDRPSYSLQGRQTLTFNGRGCPCCHAAQSSVQESPHYPPTHSHTRTREKIRTHMQYTRCTHTHTGVCMHTQIEHTIVQSCKYTHTHSQPPPNHAIPFINKLCLCLERSSSMKDKSIT